MNLAPPRPTPTVTPLPYTTLVRAQARLGRVPRRTTRPRRRPRRQLRIGDSGIPQGSCRTRRVHRLTGSTSTPPMEALGERCVGALRPWALERGRRGGDPRGVRGALVDRTSVVWGKRVSVLVDLGGSS